VDSAALVFQAGTSWVGDHLVTNGGRILTIVGLGDDLTAARTKAYANIARVTFAGARFRTDIGAGV
jgi:phosphoribosylamine--glycine ligase